MNEIIKNAVSDLYSLDDKQVVKVAGVLQRIRNWLKSLTNPEYRERVSKLKNDSVQISSYLKNLDKYLQQINVAIENGDVDQYNQALEEIKYNASFISKELNELSDSAQDAAPPTEAPKIETSESKGILKQNDTLGGDNLVYTQNFMQSLKLRQKFAGIISSAGFSKEEANESLNDKEFWDALKNAVGVGKVVSVSHRAKADDPNLIGDYIYLVFSEEFTVPKLPISLQVLAEVVDKTYNAVSPNPIKVMKWINRIHPIKLGPKARARVARETAPWWLTMEGIRNRQKQYDRSKFIPVKVTRVAKEDFITALRNIWPRIIKDIPMTEQAINLLYAQAALETGNFSDLRNYNFGNIKASPQSGKWTAYPCGETLDGKSYKFTAKHPMCYFRAYDSLEEGVAFYVDLLAKRYHSALLEASKGNVQGFAEQLKENGYYTASTQAYTKGLNRYINPQTEAPAQNDELKELEQVLGINLTAMVNNSISDMLLPRKDISIKIKAGSLPTMVEYASILSDCLDRTIDADTEICYNDKDIKIKEIVINCNTTGGIEEIKEAIQEIDNIVSKAFLDKYKEPVITVIKEGSCNYNNMGQKKIERNRRKFKCR